MTKKISVVDREPFRFTDDEWRELCSLREFDSEALAKGLVREEISAAADDYCRRVTAGSLDLNPNALVDNLRAVTQGFEKIQEAIDTLRKINELKDPVVFGFVNDNSGDTFLYKLREQHFSNFDEFQKILTACQRESPRVKPGQKGNAIAGYLVHRVELTLIQYSKSGPSNRSIKLRAPESRHARGTFNDLDFYRCLFKITLRETNVKVGEGTNVNALKVVIQSIRSHAAMIGTSKELGAAKVKGKAAVKEFFQKRRRVN